eukprot:gb/GFBE01068490.1/.p1 GENE.gb/GFBE01068490.1/~~gb/GFBE01068490.1/.p1  ORF type:complete len:185 (+),score=35.84 gb/GFBE01068490.1/:1-555(+)
MLLPMPPMPTPGTSSGYAKSRQYAILSLLVAQSVLVLMRWVLLLDILGGFVMALATGFGWYAYKEDLHITFLCYWGMMCLINGVFDFVKFIDYWVHDPMPIFASNLPLSYNLSSLTMLLVPLVTLPGALIAWYIYKDASEGDVGSYGSYSSRDQETTPLRSSGSVFGRSSFQAFGGQGQRLGAA